MMHSDLTLFTLAILKCALVTGIGPGLVLFLVLRKMHGKTKLRKKAEVIEFPSWGGRTVPVKIQGQACIGTGARPVNFGAGGQR